MRTKKIILNGLSELIPYFIISIIAFVKVRVMIDNLGSEFNGYYQFINQIITYLFLVEAGFGSAVLFKLYKPMADNNQKKVSEIFNGSITIFRKIGALILTLLIAITLVLPFTVTNDEHLFTIIISFIIIGFSQTIPYFFYSKSYSILLFSEQKNYIYSIIVNMIKIIIDVGIIVVVIITDSLINVAVVMLIGKILEEIIADFLCSRMYKWLDKKAKKDISAHKMTKDIIYHKIGELVVNNVDSIILMTFIGPIAVSIYATYNYISSFLTQVIAKIDSGIISTFGNIFSKEDNDTSFKLFKEFSIISDIMAFIVPICFILGGRSFINLWIGKESYILSYWVVAMFASIIFFKCIVRPINTVITANGMFRETKYYAFFAAGTNLLLSIMLVKPLGIFGILFATVIGYMVSLTLRVKLVYNHKFDFINKKLEYTTIILKIIIYMIIVFLLKPIEGMIFSYELSIINFLLLIGSIFVILTLRTGIIIYKYNTNFKSVYSKVINSIFKRSKVV